MFQSGEYVWGDLYKGFHCMISFLGGGGGGGVALVSHCPPLQKGKDETRGHDLGGTRGTDRGPHHLVLLLEEIHCRIIATEHWLLSGDCSLVFRALASAQKQLSPRCCSLAGQTLTHGERVWYFSHNSLVLHPKYIHSGRFA